MTIDPEKSFQIIPPNRLNELMELLDPVIEIACPAHIYVFNHQLPFYTAQDKIALRKELHQIVEAKLNNLIESLNSQKGHHFLKLMQEYIQQSPKENQNRLVSSKTTADLNETVKVQRMNYILSHLRSDLNQEISNTQKPLSANGLILLIDLFTATSPDRGFVENLWTEQLENKHLTEQDKQDIKNKESLDKLLDLPYLSQTQKRDFAVNILEQRFGMMIRNNTIRKASGLIDGISEMIEAIPPNATLNEALNSKDSSGATLGAYFRHITGVDTMPDSSPKLQRRGDI